MCGCFDGLCFGVHVQTREYDLVGDNDGENTAKSESIEQEAISGRGAPESLSAEVCK